LKRPRPVIPFPTKPQIRKNSQTEKGPADDADEADESGFLKNILKNKKIRLNPPNPPDPRGLVRVNSLLDSVL